MMKRVTMVLLGIVIATLASAVSLCLYRPAPATGPQGAGVLVPGQRIWLRKADGSCSPGQWAPEITTRLPPLTNDRETVHG